jgi:hypothetical protein
MGVSLPLLARAFTARIERAPLVVGLETSLAIGARLGSMNGTGWVQSRFGFACRPQP